MKGKKKSESQVPITHYFNLKYDTKNRWISYWHQIEEVVKCKPKNVLEIGVGNKTVSDYLKKIGIDVTTCDFDKNLNSDIIADVRNLPFKEKSFDVVLCAEVLEHIPYQNFSKALKEIYRVTSNSAIITLPHFSLTYFYLGLKLIPYIPKKEVSLLVDYPVKHIFEGEHYWEVGKKGFALQNVASTILESGFIIKRTFYPKEDPRHQFFVLSK